MLDWLVALTWHSRLQYHCRWQSAHTNWASRFLHPWHSGNSLSWLSSAANIPSSITKRSLSSVSSSCDCVCAIRVLEYESNLMVFGMINETYHIDERIALCIVSSIFTLTLQLLLQQWVILQLLLLRQNLRNGNKWNFWLWLLLRTQQWIFGGADLSIEKCVPCGGRCDGQIAFGGGEQTC